MKRKTQRSFIKAKIKVKNCSSYCNQHFVIHQNTFKYFFWQNLMIISNIVSSFFYLELLTFENLEQDKLYYYGDFFFTSLYMMDLMINLFLEKVVIKQDETVLVRDIFHIWCIYIKGNFLFDVVTLLPLPRIFSPYI